MKKGVIHKIINEFENNKYASRAWDIGIVVIGLYVFFSYVNPALQRISCGVNF